MGSAPLVGRNLKQQVEAAIFEAFKGVNPNFAGCEIAHVEWGGDPPDVLCLDPIGNRIGVELTEWLNPEQIERSKHQYRLEESYLSVIRSRDEPLPAHFGFVLMATRDVRLAPEHGEKFRTELYRFLSQVDQDWNENPDWHDSPGGALFDDFHAYPVLAEHLVGLVLHSRRFGPGVDWICFRPHGGAYSPEWMQNALLNNISNKIRRYSTPEASKRLLDERLSQFLLVAYYDQASLHNSPYDAPGFGFPEIGASLAAMLAGTSHPFHRVFLYSPVEKIPFIQVWPAI
jgi:hypothetical protein